MTKLSIEDYISHIQAKSDPELSSYYLVEKAFENIMPKEKHVRNHSVFSTLQNQNLRIWTPLYLSSVNASDLDASKISRLVKS